MALNDARGTFHILEFDYNNEDPAGSNKGFQRMALTHVPDGISQWFPFECCSSDFLNRRVWGKVRFGEDCAIIETKETGLRRERSLDPCLCGCTDSSLCLSQFCTRQKRRMGRYETWYFKLSVAHDVKYRSTRERKGSTMY